ENTLKQGDTLTRTVKIQARGVLPDTIPDLIMKDGVGYKVYPSEPKTSLGYDSSGLISIWERDFVIIPTESGEVQITDLSFSWFNTTKNEETMTFIPGKILDVEENPVFSKENPVSPTELKEEVKTPPQTEAQKETLCTPVGEKNFFEKENNLLFFISGLFFGWITVLLSIFIIYLIKRRKKKLPDLYPY
ncbi:MAG: BatD family protein, partial [Alphaproteobacteria bacterium]|nr:BatD family protein [Alphaproteobacteria bacterium]